MEKKWLRESQQVIVLQTLKQSSNEYFVFHWLDLNQDGNFSRWGCKLLSLSDRCATDTWFWSSCCERTWQLKRFDVMPLQWRRMHVIASQIITPKLFVQQSILAKSKENIESEENNQFIECWCPRPVHRQNTSDNDMEYTYMSLSSAMKGFTYLRHLRARKL